MYDKDQFKFLQEDLYEEKAARVILEARVKYLEDQLALLKADVQLFKRQFHAKDKPA